MTDAERKPCPVPGCTRTAGQGKLMCWTCWRRVPRRLQRAVYRTFEDWTHAPRGGAERSARAAYDAAAQAAIDAALGRDA